MLSRFFLRLVLHILGESIVYKMSILFDEKAMVKNVLEDGFSNGRANKYELILLGKHYRWNLGYGSTRIKKSIIEFCKEHDQNFNPVLSRDFVNDIVKISENNTFRQPVPVQIMNTELYAIKTIKNFDYQKILFTMLVFAKTLKFMNSDVSGKSSMRKPFGYYINLGMVSRIKKVAEVKRISNNNFMYILHDINNMTDKIFVEPTFHNSVKILYASDNGVPTIIVNDFSNIINYYIEYVGGELLYCVECGKEFKKEGNRKRDLCDYHYSEKIKEQTRNRVARYRKKMQN